MRNGKQSVFRDERKRYEPVNRQAAGVFRRATWDEMPAAEPRYVPDPKEAGAASVKAAEARLAQIKVEQKQHRLDVRSRKAQIKEWNKNRERLGTCLVHARTTLRTIHKRKGLPKPTVAEVHAFARTLPMHGQRLHS